MLNPIIERVNKLFMPNKKYFPDPSQEEIACKRNQMIVAMMLMFVFYVIGDMFFCGTTVINTCFRLLFIVIVLCILFISCRFNPQIFNVSYNLMLLSFGLLTMDFGEKDLLVALLSTQVTPLFIFIMTGSIYHVIFQGIGQAVILNTMYSPHLTKTFLYLSQEDFSGALINGSNLVLFAQLICIGCAHYFTEKAYKNAFVAEKKRCDAENSKIFLMGFSHELRNLINGLTGNVKLASMEQLNHKTREFITNANVCGELLLHLVNTILDSGKAELGELEVNPTPTKVHEALEKMWSICSELITRKNLRGKLCITKNVPVCLIIDQFRLTQIFLNLIGNAIKFTDQGSVDIDIEWIPNKESISEESFQPYPFNSEDDHDEGLYEKDQHIAQFNNDSECLNASQKAYRRGSTSSAISPPLNKCRGILKVKVSDSGCGMTKEESEKLFQKFTQVSSDPSKKKMGTGLGLFITKQLCQKMGGDIKVFSQKNKGSVFMFCIPVEPSNEPEKSTAEIVSIGEILDKRHLNAMIVDDDPFNHLVIKGFFKTINVNVMNIAVNGAEAVSKFLKGIIENNYPQIITLDMEMPIMNGKEAAMKIREIEERRRLKPSCIIIISGDRIEDDVKECLDRTGKIRASAFLTKPVRMEELLRVIKLKFMDFKSEQVIPAIKERL